jgi:hypothetical protein
MLNRCRNCDEILKDGDVIRVVVVSVYHLLKSKVHFAISNSIQDADASTLEHVDCLKGEPE